MAVSLKYFIEAKDKSGKALKSAEGGLDNLASAAKKVGGALAVAFAADQAMDMARLGATAERVEQRFAAFSKEAGGATAILNAFQTGAGGAASKMESMTTASRLLQMGLVEDAAGMERVVEMATRMGDQTQGVTDRVSDFALMLANQSIPRLDNFGISSGKVRARIAELQATTEGMSREAAFMAAVMEEGGAALEVLGPRADDSLMSFEKMEAQMADLKVEIGQALVPAMVSLVQVFSQVLAAASPLIDTFASMTAGLGEMDAAIDSTQKKAESMGKGLTELVDGGAEMSDALDAMGNKLDNAANEWNNMSNVQKVAVGLLGKGADYTNQMQDATEGLGRSVVAASSSYAEYKSQIDEYNSSVVNASAKIRVLGENQYKYAKIQETATVRAQEQEAAWAALEVQAEGTGLSAQELAWKQLELAMTGQTLIGASRSASTAQELHNRALRDNVNTTGSAMAKANEMVAARQNANAMAEKAAALESMAADSARRLAEAQQVAAAAAAAHAAEQGNLMVQLSGATEEQFKQAVFAEIDPAAIGVDAYAALGVELGVLDEKSANLAAAVPALVDAYNAGIIPTENMAAVTTDLFNAAGDAEFNVGALLDQYAKAPGLIGPSADAADDFATRMENMGEYVETATGQLDALAAAFGDVTAEASKLPAVPSAPGSSIPTFDNGGTMPGTIGGPHALAWMKPGERAVPQGMSVGPTGPPTTNNTFNNTFNVPSLLAAKLIASQGFEARKARM